MATWILGISAYYHDAAAALLRDGEVIAAAQEERFTRRKHDWSFPIHAIRYCLREGGIEAKDLDYVGFYDRPLVKFERILQTYLATFPRSLPAFLKALPPWLRQKLWIRYEIRKALDYEGPILFAEHHMSHAASAFLVSPFDEAAILTTDGVGEWATTTYGVGRGNRIELFKEVHFPHSLGLLYSAFTYYLGFKVNSAEYKVMGLAPYGRPVYLDKMRELIDIREDGSFRLNMDYFAYHYGLRMTNGRFHKLFGRPPRRPGEPIESFHQDVAASLQAVTEEALLRMANHLHRETGLKKLCMAGGVALNCVANGRILRETPFEELFVQPAASDAGGAVGIAAYIYYTLLDRPRNWHWQHAYLGPEFSTEEVRSVLERYSIPYEELDREELLRRTASLIAQQRVVGWFQGRMEFGPRALGNRSILGDPRNPENKDRINLKVKFRESFRPFAPSVLEERASDYFELSVPSPYMLLTARVREDNRTIPAVTHVDGSARIQTVRREDNPLFYDLLKEFERQTGCPVLINTSFNQRGEPIVCTPEDALACFLSTNMDDLIIDRFHLAKERMPEAAKSWKRRFEPD
jgi:carbamoyltransferase